MIHSLMPKVTEQHLEAKRELILQAAIACFARDGFHKTKMSDIAEMAGVSDGLAYRYFSGKEEIVREAIKFATGSPELVDVEALDDDVESVVDLIVRMSFQRFARSDRRTTVGIRMRSWSEALENDDIRDQVVDRWVKYDPVMEGVWSRAQVQGSVPGHLDAAAIAQVILAIHDGLDVQWALDPSIDVEACREVVLALIQGRLWLGESSDLNQ